MNKRKSIRPLLILILLMIPSLLWAQGSIELTSRVEMEVIKVNPQGEKETVRVPAERVVPGETVIYTNAYKNNSDQSANNIVINNPVPENTNYIAGSAFGQAEILFSADKGKNFAEKGKVTLIGEDGKPRLATPSEYTNLRWTIKNELQPGESGEVGFRVRLQ